MSNAKKIKKDGKTFYRVSCAYCEEIIEYPHGKGKYIKECPHCGVISDLVLKPKTERVLFELQEEYFKTIDMEAFEVYAIEIKKPKYEQNDTILNNHVKNINKKVLSEMYTTLVDYTSSLLKKSMKKKGFFLSSEDFNDKVLHAVFLVLDIFMKKPGNQIRGSWAGQINHKIKEALYKYANDDVHDSLDKVINESSNDKNVQLIDMESSMDFKPMFMSKDYSDPLEEAFDFGSELKKVLYKMFSSIKEKVGYRRAMLSLIGFRLFSEHKNQRLNKFYEVYGRETIEDVESFKISFRRYLRNIRQNF